MIMTGVETRHRLPHQQPRQPPSSVRTKQEGVRQQELSNLEVDISILMPTQSYADSVFFLHRRHLKMLMNLHKGLLE